MERFKSNRDGDITIPGRLLKTLGVRPGQEVTITYHEGKLHVEKYVAVDPFLEAQKKPDADALEKAFEAQKDRATKAEEQFNEEIKKPQEYNPEDNPDFWR